MSKPINTAAAIIALSVGPSPALATNLSRLSSAEANAASHWLRRPGEPAPLLRGSAQVRALNLCVRS
jgi:hypothetical protein